MKPKISAAIALSALGIALAGCSSQPAQTTAPQVETQPVKQQAAINPDLLLAAAKNAAGDQSITLDTPLSEVLQKIEVRLTPKDRKIEPEELTQLALYDLFHHYAALALPYTDFDIKHRIDIQDRRRALAQALTTRFSPLLTPKIKLLEIK